MIKVVLRKPETYTAVQFTRDNKAIKDVAVILDGVKWSISLEGVDLVLKVLLHGKEYVFYEGNWIVRLSENRIFHCTDSEFRATFREYRLGEEAE